LQWTLLVLNMCEKQRITIMLKLFLVTEESRICTL